MKTGTANRHVPLRIILSCWPVLLVPVALCLATCIAWRWHPRTAIASRLADHSIVSSIPSESSALRLPLKAPKVILFMGQAAYWPGAVRSDEDLAYLARSEHAKIFYSLEIGGQGITDAGLQSLAALRNLHHLTISEPTGATETGLSALHKALPQCAVTHKR